MFELFILTATVLIAIHSARMAVVSYLEFEDALDKPFRDLDAAIKKAKESRQ